MRKLGAVLVVIVLLGASAFIGYRLGHKDGVRDERLAKEWREFHLGGSREAAVLGLYVLGFLETNNVSGASAACIDPIVDFYRAVGPSTRPEWKDDIMYGDLLRRIEARAERLPELRQKLQEAKR